MKDMIREVSLQYKGRARVAPERIRNSDNAARFFMESIGSETREQMAAIYLNGRHVPLTKPYIVSVGTLISSLVHPREIFRVGIHIGAAALLLAHNHPSGDETPSEEDWDVTTRLQKAGKLIGIEVLDHIIIGYPKCFSMREDDRWTLLADL